MPRSWSAAGTFCAGLVVVAAVAFADGGFFRDRWLWIVLALASLAGIALLLRERIEVGLLEPFALGALALFIGWTALSATWSSDEASSLHDAQRGLIYVVALVAFVLVLDRETVPALLGGVASGSAAVAGYALIERGVNGAPESPDPISGTRLIEPLGYANALAILCAVGILLALGLAWEARSPRERLVWIALVVVQSSALVLTESRGTVLALVAGLAVFALTRTRHPAALAGVGLTLLAVVAAAAVAVDRALGSRVDYWRVAWREYEANPVLGSGAGTFHRYWEQAAMPVSVRDAHSLYLETLAELGPVGLGLVVVALGLPLVAFALAPRDAAAGIAASAYAAFLVHAGLDWDWEMPAVTLAGFACAAAVLVTPRRVFGMIGVETTGRIVCAAAVVALAVAAIALQVLVD